MNHFTKMLWSSVFLLMLNIQAIFAVSITYSLTTHIDGRTITEAVNVIAGDNLEDNMPQKFWRAYTTYTYYSDADKTQEITTVPSEDATVYVDYVFSPPYAQSSQELNVWYLLRAFKSNGNPYYYYSNGTQISALDGDPATKGDAAKWAFYGDGFCLNLLNKDENEWLGYNSDISDTEMKANPLNPGWQLYLSIFEKDHIRQWVLGVPQENDALSAKTKVLGLHDMSSRTSIVTPHDNDNSAYYDSQAILHYRHDKITWNLFFGTIAKDANSVWHVEYRVSYENNTTVDRYFYDKDMNSHAVDYYFRDKKSYLNYEYYHDEAMTQPWDPTSTTDLIPPLCVTVVYVKVVYPHKQEYVTDHWITIVLPYDVENVKDFFGTAADKITPAVRVLEYDGLTISEYPHYDLHFKAVGAMEANKPYLFKADECLAEHYLPLALGESTGDENDLTTISFNDPSSTRPDVYISMKGTYDGIPLDPTTMTPDEKGEVDYIYFYFGYNPKYDPQSSNYVGEIAAAGKYPYNFYPVKGMVNIPESRCYFKIYSNEGNSVGYSQLGFNNDDVITGVSESMSENNTKAFKRSGIYHISGKRMNTSIENLPKGMYIVNGEKVIVK